jgi:hypothetical protein
MDVSRQLIVDLPPKLLERHVQGDFKVGNLHEGVHARIRAASSLTLEIVVADGFGNGSFQFALHGACIDLLLPAAVAASGVFECQLEPGHGGTSYKLQVQSSKLIRFGRRIVATT